MIELITAVSKDRIQTDPDRFRALALERDNPQSGGSVEQAKNSSIVDGVVLFSTGLYAIQEARGVAFSFLNRKKLGPTMSISVFMPKASAEAEDIKKKIAELRIGLVNTLRGAITTTMDYFYPEDLDGLDCEQGYLEAIKQDSRKHFLALMDFMRPAL